MQDIIKTKIDEISNILLNLNWDNIPASKIANSNITGSYLYIMYNQFDEVLYVGQTSKSLARRCILDGSGAHNKKEWYKDISYIRITTLSGDYSSNHNMRKILERILICSLNPKYNID